MEPTEKAAGPVWGWVIVILVAALVVAWGLASFVLVPDVPRAFNSGALPDAPGESVYSTNPTPREAVPPLQIPSATETLQPKESGGAP
jgi:hypothetical protein